MSTPKITEFDQLRQTEQVLWREVQRTAAIAQIARGKWETVKGKLELIMAEMVSKEEKK